MLMLRITPFIALASQGDWACNCWFSQYRCVYSLHMDNFVSLVFTWYQWPEAVGRLMAGHGVSYQGIARDWWSVTDIELP